MIVDGGRYDVESFNAQMLEDIGEKINNVWYMYDSYTLNRLRIDEDVENNREFINKELAVLNRSYLSIPESVSKIAKISGEFYTDEYQPIQYEPPYHDALLRLYKIQSAIVCTSNANMADESSDYSDSLFIWGVYDAVIC